MAHETLFPALTDWELTRHTLQLYSRALAIIPRTHAEFHPKWWHISLKVEPDGLVTERMPLPDGGDLWLKMDLLHHQVVLFANDRAAWDISLSGGLTATELGDQIINAVAGFGLKGDYAREKFENDEARQYDPAAAGRYLTALVNTNRIFEEHQATLSGDIGPLQLWPHGFDLAFEWFGTRVETYEENGEIQEYPSQINLGLFPGGPETTPYFFSNPWPFEADELIGKPLPVGASWHTEGWQGTLLPYDELVGDDNAEARLREYARAVFAIASSTLLV
jgi:hypothetical protein